MKRSLVFLLCFISILVNAQVPTSAPTFAPTVPVIPTVGVPTLAPTTPTPAPTSAPTVAPTNAPTTPPSPPPTAAPTVAPTSAPTVAPTSAPTSAPTAAPTSTPTAAPTSAPTVAPTSAPTIAAPTATPTMAPTDAPTHAPTAGPTAPVTPTPTTPTPTPTPTPTSTPTPTPSPDTTIPDVVFGYLSEANTTGAPPPRSGSVLGLGTQPTDIVLLGANSTGHPDNYKFTVAMPQGKWTPFNLDFNTVGACATQGSLDKATLWLFGGEINGTPSQLLQQYAFGASSITIVNATNPPMETIGTACAVDPDSNFFVYGGKHNSSATSCTSSMSMYSSVYKNWTAFNSSSVKALEGASLVYNGADSALYMFGGSASCQNNPVNDLYKFTIATKTWDAINPFNAKPPARAYHNAMISNGHLYIFGGETTTTQLDDVWRYNISGNSWEEVNLSSSRFSRPARRSRAASASNHNQFFIYGGTGPQTTAATYNDLWQLIVEKDCFSSLCDNCVANSFANCGWCPDNQQGQQCVAGTISGPYVANTCAKPENFSNDSNDCPETGFPSWAIALIVIGGVVLIGIIVFAIMKFREKNEYQEIR